MPKNKPPIRPPERERVYDVIDGEIECQAETTPEVPPLSEILVVLIGEIRRASTFQVDGYPEATTLTVNALRRVAATCIRGMDAHGVIPREYHVPASAGITGTLNVTNPPDHTT